MSEITPQQIQRIQEADDVWKEAVKGACPEGVDKDIWLTHVIGFTRPIEALPALLERAERYSKEQMAYNQMTAFAETINFTGTFTRKQP